MARPFNQRLLLAVIYRIVQLIGSLLLALAEEKAYNSGWVTMLDNKHKELIALFMRLIEHAGYNLNEIHDTQM